MSGKNSESSEDLMPESSLTTTLVVVEENDEAINDNEVSRKRAKDDHLEGTPKKFKSNPLSVDNQELDLQNQALEICNSYNFTYPNHIRIIHATDVVEKPSNAVEEIKEYITIEDIPNETEEDNIDDNIKIHNNATTVEYLAPIESLDPPVIRSKEDIERGIESVAKLTSGQGDIVRQPVKDDNLTSFWYAGIYECLACEERPPKQFSCRKWKWHIKTSHDLSISSYKAKFGNPDLTKFQHTCYLCQRSFQQIHSVIKAHLESFHGDLTVEQYTQQFRNLIIEEISLQPALPSQNVLEGWSYGCVYKCNFCAMTMYSIVQLSKHTIAHHKGASKPQGPFLPVLVRYHKCYICGKKLKHEHKILYHHLHTAHSIDVNSYASQFEEYVRLELKLKGMDHIMEYEKNLASRPTLQTYHEGIQALKATRKGAIKDNQDEIETEELLLKDWADYCDFKCFCNAEETFRSHLKFHGHISRKHGYKSMAQYKSLHGEPSVIHRLHKCRLCQSNIKWEASRIRDHLKKHRDPESGTFFTLPQYASKFRKEILVDIQKVINVDGKDIQEKSEEVPFRLGRVRLGGDKLEYSQSEWKELNRKKVSPTNIVMCPVCTEVMKQASLHRHINNVHPNTLESIQNDLKAGKIIDPKWRNLHVDHNISEEEDQTENDQDLDGEKDLQEDLNEATNETPNEDQSNTEDDSSIKQKSEANEIRNVYIIDSVTGEIICQPSGNLPIAENLELVRLADNSGHEVYIAKSSAAAKDEANAVFDEYLEETGSLTGQVFEIPDNSEEFDNIKKDSISTNYIKENHIEDTNHKNDDIDIETYEDNSISDDDLTEYESEQTIFLSEDCKSYIISEQKIVEKVVNKDDLVTQIEDTSNEVYEDVRSSSNDNTNKEISPKETSTDSNGPKENSDKKHLSIEVNHLTSRLKLGPKDKQYSESPKSATDGEIGEEKEMEKVQENPPVEDSENPQDEQSKQQQMQQQQPFQSFIIGNNEGGGIQRIAVIHHRKGDPQNVNFDRSLLLNHISNLINTMDSTSENSSDNLKIIEIEVETDDTTIDNTSISENILLKNLKALKKKSGKKGGTSSGSKNSYGFSIKTISLPAQHSDDRISRGTQISKWTKMGDELQKISTRKILESSIHDTTDAKEAKKNDGTKEVAGDESIEKEKESVNNEDEGTSWKNSKGVLMKSVAVQVMWESRIRGTMDMDDENAARDRITTWILDSPEQLYKSRKCPGCHKEFARNRNLLQHLQTKHEVKLSGTLGDSYKVRMKSENRTINCPQCDIKISRKSLRRHQRQVHGVFPTNTIPSEIP